jgi:hypothetical protein
VTAIVGDGIALGVLGGDAGVRELGADAATRLVCVDLLPFPFPFPDASSKTATRSLNLLYQALRC